MEVRHHDHHAEQKHDRIVVDGSVCFLKGKDIEGNHQAGADNGCARAIHAEPGQSADGQYKIRTKKDESGSQHIPYFLLNFGDSHHNSLIVESNRQSSLPTIKELW